MDCESIYNLYSDEVTEIEGRVNRPEIIETEIYGTDLRVGLSL